MIAHGPRRHWRRARAMTAWLLLVWFAVTFVIAWYARELSFEFFGWPFSFYMGAQGAIVVYLLIAAGYARHMNRLDAQADDARPAGR